MAPLTHLRALESDEVAALDATYQPIPAFAAWPQDPPRPELWNRLREELVQLRQSPGAEPLLSGAIDTVLRTAAFETGAIEGLYTTDRGLTFSVATQAAAWESAVNSRSPDALKLFQAQLTAYQLVLDVATQSRPVTEIWIRNLHEVLTGPQETYTVMTPVGLQERPLPRGEYKRDPNHVYLENEQTHSYAPVQDTPPEMARLVAELQTEVFADADPVIQASYAHYCLAAIHPFADGNGRVARAVASTFLYRAASVPLLVLADQRTEYFLALERADRGDRAPFVIFVSEAARSAIAMVSDGLRTALAPRAEDAATALRQLLVAQGGLTHQELGAVAARLAGELASAMNERLAALDLPPGVSGNAPIGGTRSSAQRPGFGPLPPQENGAHATNAVWLNLQSAAPATATTNIAIEIMISTANDEAETFMIAVESEDHSDLVFGLREVYPELTVAATYRLGAFVDRVTGVELAKLVAGANASLARYDYGPHSYRSRIRAGDLALPIDPDTLRAYITESQTAQNLIHVAQEAGFTSDPADARSIDVLEQASVRAGFASISELDRFLATRADSARRALDTIWQGRLVTEGEWITPPAFLVAAMLWVGTTISLDEVRQASGGDRFFVSAIEAARAAIGPAAEDDRETPRASES